MSPGVELFLVFIGGLSIGALFCLTLWCSLRRLVARRSHGVALLTGGAIRVVVVLATLYLITGLRPVQVAIALAGFILARAIVARALCASLTAAALAPDRRRA